ncbi:LacI family DNA-binding transcriptional regulator [Cobetia amphilecti]|uniref:LacI family DNA-binding transcriptional regulator n=1 Tax=Cobetia amphilecti TaxID=1055104 RepID=UPI0026E391B4|nr:LacI family DNA-binding transcriptional regulator [Cobetia amphilecti]MDO6814336.1 LacI family DNA-binding transcriptional regulator [Cobetia amphilecti]
MNKPRRAGVREVAQLAGVSVATVSRVLNNPEKVVKKTADKVLAAADALDFLPNNAARVLSQHQSRTLGIVIPTFENPIYAKFIDALEGALARAHYSLLVTTTQKGRVTEFDKVRELVNMGVDAVILPGGSHAAETLDYLSRFSVPVVFNSIYLPDSPLITVGYDNYGLAKALAEYLMSLGHQRIVILSEPLAHNDRARLRYDGAVAALQALESAGADREHDQFVDVTTAGASAAIGELSCEPGGALDGEGQGGLRDGITAVMCLNDVLASGAMLALQRRGIRVPQQVSVVGFDDLEMAEFLNPPLTTVDLPVEEMGEVIAQALIRHLEDDAPLTSRLLDASLAIRGSAGPAPSQG